MRRAIHVTSSHPADDIRILRRECIALRTAGYEVAYVVAGAASTEVNGVQVVGVAGGRSKLQRFFLNPARVLFAALRLRPSVLHLHDPELLPWVPLLRLLGKRVIVDIHENMDGLLTGREWMPRPLVGVANWMAVMVEAIACGRANAVIAAGEDIASRLERFQPHLVRNFPAATDVPASIDPEAREKDVVVFVGAITGARAIRELIKALPLVAAHRPVRLRLIGKCQPPALLAELQALSGWMEVEYLGQQPRDVVLQHLSRASIGVALLSPRPNHYGVRANKVFEYMGSAVPVLASDFPHWRAFIEQWQCGCVVDPTSPTAIADAIRSMLDNMSTSKHQGVRGREAVRATLNWEAEAPNLLAVYDEVLGRNDPTGEA